MPSGRRKTTFMIEGIPYIFDKNAYIYHSQNYYNQARSTEKITWTTIYNQLSELLPNYSLDALKNWRKKNNGNGPSELHAIEVLAQYFELDYMVLLTPLQKGAPQPMNNTNPAPAANEAELVRNIYRGVLRFRLTTIDYFELKQRMTEYNDFSICKKMMLRDLRRMIDDAFLSVSESTCRKLKRILIEAEEEAWYHSDVPARWDRLNPLFDWARIYQSVQSGDDLYDEEYLNSDEGRASIREMTRRYQCEAIPDDFVAWAEIDADDIFLEEYAFTIQCILKEDFPQLCSFA